MVRDFYHNFLESTSIKASEVSVRVRGKQVMISLNIIEKILGLPYMWMMRKKMIILRLL